MPAPRLPIDDVIPALRDALRTARHAVLVAPPGAGKTTRVPLALLGEPWCTGRVLVLEPRRLAARAAAHQMARLLDEITRPPSGTVDAGGVCPGSVERGSHRRDDVRMRRRRRVPVEVDEPARHNDQRGAPEGVSTGARLATVR